jgi:hypothetical protein
MTATLSGQGEPKYQNVYFHFSVAGWVFSVQIQGKFQKMAKTLVLSKVSLCCYGLSNIAYF